MTDLTEEIERIGGAPGDDPMERLLHTLLVYEDEPDDSEVVCATRGVYGRGVWTGISWGDLRALAARLEEPIPWEQYRVGIVSCDACGKQWYDLDAATDCDGTTDAGCPNGCKSLTTPVYDLDGSLQRPSQGKEVR